MVSQYYWDVNQLRKCRRCGKGQNPGHSRRCKGKKSRVEIEDDKKVNEAKVGQTAIDLEVGFDLLGASER